MADEAVGARHGANVVSLCCNVLASVVGCGGEVSFREVVRCALNTCWGEYSTR